MHYSFVLVLLSALPAFAIPTNSTLHFLSKRDNVCSLDFRNLVDTSSCTAKGISFTQNGATVTRATGATATADLQCDHVIELQFLNKNLNDRGICTAISKLGSVVTTPSAATLLNPVANIISGQTNLNFLTSAVNNKKKNFVLGSGVTGTDDVTKAVKSYLTQTTTESKGVATSLDTAINAMVAAIRAASNANLPAPPAKSSSGRPQRQSAQDAAKAALQAAAGKMAGTPSVVTSWNAVLANAAR